MILFDRSKFTRLVVFGTTPSDTHTLSAALGVPDKPGTRLAIDGPSPDDRNTLPGEVFHKIRLFHKVRGVLRLADLWSVGYRQGLRLDGGARVISVPVTRLNSLLRSGLGRTRGNANDREIWTGV